MFAQGVSTSHLFRPLVEPSSAWRVCLKIVHVCPYMPLREFTLTRICAITPPPILLVTKWRVTKLSSPNMLMT